VSANLRAWILPLGLVDLAIDDDQDACGEFSNGVSAARPGRRRHFARAGINDYTAVSRTKDMAGDYYAMTAVPPWERQHRTVTCSRCTRLMWRSWPSRQFNGAMCGGAAGTDLVARA